MEIGLNPFFLETAKTELFPRWYTHEWLLQQVNQTSFAHARKGYREGVLLVPLLADGWKTRVVTLEEGDIIEGEYKSRVPGETPRKQTGVWRKELPDAGSVEVVLYAEWVLAEKDETRSGAEWDIITVLVHPKGGPSPMSVGTLMANHFGADGGTNTLMSCVDFEANLKESFRYWADKGIAKVRPSVDDVKEILKKANIRIVGMEDEEDYFGNKLTLVHPHIMDLYNNWSDEDSKLTGVPYNAGRNAFIIRM